MSSQRCAQELEASNGQIRTIDNVSIFHHIGATSIQTQLNLKIRAATEGNIVLNLPSTQITKLSLNGTDIPIVQEGNALQIPTNLARTRSALKAAFTEGILSRSTLTHFA